MPPPEIADHVGTLAGVIASQAEVIAAQQSTINALSGGRLKSLALKQTIGEMWIRHFATLPDVPWKKSTGSVMKFCIKELGHVKLADFGPRTWESFRDAPETKEKYGNTSLNNILVRLKIMLSRAVDAGELHESPLQRVRPLRKVPKRTTELSEESEEVIMADMDQMTRTMFVVALDSAMRRDEARLLQWVEIDLPSKTVNLPAYRTKTKTARTAYLTARAVEMLRALPRYKNCPWVFANPDTLRPYSKTRFWNHFRRAVDDNGIKPSPGDGAARFHDLTRRSAACRLVRRGAPLPAVQMILGHSQMTSTLEYVSAQQRDVLKAHALLEKAKRKGPHRAPSSDRAPRVRSANGPR